MTEAATQPVDVLSEGADTLAAAHHELASLLDELQAALAGSLIQWDDTARAAYEKSQVQWAVALQRQQEIMAEIPHLLDTPAEEPTTPPRKWWALWR